MMEFSDARIRRAMQRIINEDRERGTGPHIF
jgi:hypothetical protein